MRIKTLIAGQGRSGKDQLCIFLKRRYGFDFSSSSWFAAKTFIFDKLKHSHGYKTIQECFDDRHTGNNRVLWWQLITEYNKDDPTRLAKEVLKNNDIYCGMRSKRELDACKEQGVFDLTVWVDASKRVDYIESKDSNELTAEDCDIIIDNNGTIQDLEKEAHKLAEKIIWLETHKAHDK